MSKSMRQIICLVLTLCLLLGSAPAVFAYEPVVTVSDAAELKAALASGGSIQLVSDITVDESLTIAEDTTLDLYGHTLTVDPEYKYANYAVLVSAALTVKDSGEGGKLTSGKSEFISTLFLDYGEGATTNSFTLKSGTIENTAESAMVIVALGTRISTVNISGGTVISNPGAGKKQGYSVYSQGDVHITGGYLGGALYLSEQGRTARQDITGGYFDRSIDDFENFNRIDFYGTRYTVTESGIAAFPYQVVKAFDGGVTVSYQFVPGSETLKRDDVFVSGTKISEPEAPYVNEKIFKAWYTDPDFQTKAEFPMTLNENLTLYGKYEDEPEEYEPEEYIDYFAEAYSDPKTIIVGGTVMLSGGAIQNQMVLGSSGSAMLLKLPLESSTGTKDVFVVYLQDYASSMTYRFESEDGTFDTGIYADGPLAVVASGKNTIHASGDYGCGAAGIAVEEGGLLLSGKLSPTSPVGTLEIITECDQSSGKGYGIYTSGTTAKAIDVLVQDCDLEINSGENSQSILNIGILAGMDSDLSGDIVFDHSDVLISSVANGYSFANVGLYTESDVVIDNSDVVIYPDCAFASTGIQCEYLEVLSDDNGKEEKKLRIDSSTTVPAFTAVGIDADMIRVAGRLTTVEAYAPDSLLGSVGVNAEYGITVIDGATLYAESGDSSNGHSTGINTGGLYLYGELNEEYESDDDDYIYFSKVYGESGESSTGNSTAIQVEGIFYSEYGLTIAYAGKAANYSDGMYVPGFIFATEESQIYAYGEEAGEYSYGICVEGTVGIEQDSYVTARGGDAGTGSRGLYIEPVNELIDSRLVIHNGGELRAFGGDAGIDSYGLKIDGGTLMIMDIGGEYTGETRLDAVGGAAPESYGVYVSEPEDNEYEAIFVSDGAIVRAQGGTAVDDGEGKSRGIWTDGDIEICGSQLEAGYVDYYADVKDDSDYSLGICMNGEDLSFRVKNESYVISYGYLGTEGCGGLYFEDEPGILTVEKGSTLVGYGYRAKQAVGIYNLQSLTADGSIIGLGYGDEGYGIIMATDAAVAVPVGSLQALGTSAAAICRYDSEWKDLYITAAGIEYSASADTYDSTVVTPEGGVSTLLATRDVKYLIAASGGDIEGVAVADVNTNLTYGQPVSFTAKVYPQIAVKVVEERWERLSDHAVFSSLDQTPAAITAGTYRYTLILETTGDTYKFFEDVTVEYNDDYADATSAGIQLSILDPEYFVADVTVSAPAPSGGGGGSSSGGSTAQQTSAGGVTTKTVNNADGGKTVTAAGSDGTSVATTTDKNGSVTNVTVTVTQKAAETARSNKLPAEIPASVPKDTIINVNVPSDNPVNISLPVSGSDSGTVLYTVNADGSREIIKTCAYEDGKVIAKIESSCKIIASDNTRYFSDVEPKRWSYDDIRAVTAREIFNGNGDGTFGLHDPVVKGMITQIFYNMEKNAKPGDTSMYTDSLRLLWFADSTGWATENKLLTGNPDGSSGGMDAADRETTITLFHRFAKFKGIDTGVRGDLSKFSDAATVRAFSKEAMEWAVGSGLIKGDGGKLNPNDLADKEMLSAMTNRFLLIMHDLLDSKQK